jgi:hypothetical protein
MLWAFLAPPQASLQGALWDMVKGMKITALPPPAHAAALNRGIARRALLRTIPFDEFSEKWEEPGCPELYQNQVALCAFTCFKVWIIDDYSLFRVIEVLCVELKCGVTLMQTLRCCLQRAISHCYLPSAQWATPAGKSRDVTGVSQWRLEPASSRAPLRAWCM